MNWAANWGPRSLINFQGIPNCFHTWSRKSLAVPIEEISPVVGMAMTYLVNQLTTTIIALYPCDIGSPVMKSTVMCSQGCSGMAFGCRGAWIFPFLVFAC